MMQLEQWLVAATKQLSDAGIATARLDCLVLLADETGRDKSWLLAHPEYELQGSIVKKLHTKIVQRAGHTPLAYIRGKAEFYGRTFAINQHVLVPRPETETMIDLLKSFSPAAMAANDTVLADIGTGSGAIAITAKLEFPEVRTIATDIDPECLKIARQNAKVLNADIELLQGDLLEPLATKAQPSIILANLPYVPERYAINQAAEHEPKHAIFAGKDGLSLYRRLWEQIAALECKPALVLTESLPPQHADMVTLAQPAGYKLREVRDFIQAFEPTD